MPNNTSKTLEDAKIYCDTIRERLPTNLMIAAISKTAKIPFKAASWNISTLHRASDLADCAYELYCEEKYVPSAIIARALMETTGIMFWMHRRIYSSVQDQNIGDIDEFFMRGIMGYKDSNEFPNALNALSAIDKIEKHYKGFRGVYDILCEFTHPNWSGTTEAYSKIYRDEMRVEYGSSIRKMKWDFIPSSMCMSLMIVEAYFEKIQELIPKFTQLCEENLNIT